MGSGTETQVTEFGSKCLSLLSCPAGPIPLFEYFVFDGVAVPVATLVVCSETLGSVDGVL